MSVPKFPPGCTNLQNSVAEKEYPPVPDVCLVTGGTGFVGRRVVELLVHRGAKKVISFDIVPKPADAWEHPNIEWIRGDLTDADAVAAACEGVDCVFHIAALVGPFHSQDLYKKVNHDGTVNVIEGCRKHKVPKIVMSSSPSTRFDGSDVDGLTEADMPQIPLKNYMQEYAATKASGEIEMTKACCDELMTIAIAPHQVYGPRDSLFLPNMLEAGASGKLRIFSHPRTGYGRIKVAFCHVDNYAHALIIGEKALYKDSPALGKFYVVTDGDTMTHPGYNYFWDEIDGMIVQQGFSGIKSKTPFPYWFLITAAYLCNVIGFFAGMKLKLNPFNVNVLCMHRWFDISASKKDIKYEPIIGFTEGWKDTGEWMKKNWLPNYGKKSNLFSISKTSSDKIDIMDKKKD